MPGNDHAGGMQVPWCVGREAHVAGPPTVEQSGDLPGGSSPPHPVRDAAEVSVVLVLRAGDVTNADWIPFAHHQLAELLTAPLLEPEMPLPEFHRTPHDTALGACAWAQRSASSASILATLRAEAPPANSESSQARTIVLASSGPMTRAPMVRIWASLLLRARSAE